MRPPYWAELSTDNEESIARAAADLIERGTKSSVFACGSRDQIELVAVALLARRTKHHFQYIEITEEDVAKAGVSAEKTDGTTRVPAADALHWELELGDGGAERLARALAARKVTYKTIKWRELGIVAKRLSDSGTVTLDATHWLLRGT